MVVNVSAVIREGVPFDCLLSERLRRTIYRVPQYFAAAEEYSSYVVFDTADFKAGVTTDPEGYFLNYDLSGQFVDDPDYRAWVRERCDIESGIAGTNPHVVIQVRQELGEWPATDGRCWKGNLGRGEHLLFVDGGEHPVPPSDDKPNWHSAVLTAVRVRLNATRSFDKVADQVSFRTTDDRWLDLLRLSVSSPEVTVSMPISANNLREKSSAIAVLAKQLGAQVDTEADPVPMRQLLEALQLEPSIDDAYRRLWFLQLHDRCKRFLHSLGRKIKQERVFGEINDHRRDSPRRC